LNVLNQEMVFFRSPRSFLYSILITTRSPSHLLSCQTTKPSSSLSYMTVLLKGFTSQWEKKIHLMGFDIRGFDAWNKQSIIFIHVA
jgi:hypothetical protein